MRTNERRIRNRADIEPSQSEYYRTLAESGLSDLYRDNEVTSRGRLKRLRRGAAVALAFVGVAVLASRCTSDSPSTGAQVTTFTDMSLNGFVFDVSLTTVPRGKQDYTYDVSMFNDGHLVRSFSYKNSASSIKGVYTFAQAGLSEGETGTMSVDVSDGNGSYASGTASIYYPSDECNKPLSLRIGGSASCAGFSVDLYGVSAKPKSPGSSEYVVFYVFSPGNSGDYIEKVYPGQNATVQGGNSSITISVTGMNTSTANLSLLDNS